jgi:serine/threonine protein kinase
VTIAGRLTAALADRYRIERELGQGGMATVYLAEDLRHDRKVAIKVLKPELAAVLGADRFVVEIKTTAALSHPHILPLFDSGTADGFLFYVMPYIKGETIREKLNRETQFGVDEAVRIAREVADALDYAHRNGVIHRDIKPENILLHDGRAMVMDFGIALAVSAAAGGRMTETGLSLGTPHYMSPEQATADKEISGRSDVYSLASVLYEMLAGQPPHLGGSAQQIIMKIIAESPQNVTALRKSVPPNVAASLTKALEKLPADRFESARAFSEALGNPAFSVHTSRSRVSGSADHARTWRFATAATGALAGVLGILLVLSLTRQQSPQNGFARDPVRFALVDDPSIRVATHFTRSFDMSPDGRTIVFQASTDSTPSRLWIRSLESPTARPLTGTERGANAAFSPDGRWIAFITDNRVLKKVRVDGGEVTTIATIDGLTAALAWSSDTLILFEQVGTVGGIHRVSASGGRVEPLVPMDSSVREGRQRRPTMLGGSGILVYGSYTEDAAEPTLVMFRIADGKRVRLGVEGNGAIGMIDNRLVYTTSDGTLMTMEIDVPAMRVVGPPARSTTRVAYGPTGTKVALSSSGVLVYGNAGTGVLERLDVVARTGGTRTLHAPARIVGVPRFSRDGKRIVVGMGTEGSTGIFRTSTSDLYTIDVATGEATRFTESNAAGPSWFPDGERIAYLKADSGKFGLWSGRLDGSARPSKLATLEGIPYAFDLSPDGSFAVVRTAEGRSSNVGALVRVSLDGSARIDTLVVATALAAGVRPEHPRISPDGKWVSFIDRSTSEVWVRSLTDASMMMVSTSAGFDLPAVWSPDSRMLYYRSAEGTSVVALETSPRLSVARRSAMTGVLPGFAFDLSPDGTTFVVAVPTHTSGNVIVAVDWANEARREWKRVDDKR